VVVDCGTGGRIRQERESQQALEELRRRLEVERIQLVQDEVLNCLSYWTEPAVESCTGMGMTVLPR